MTGPDALRSQQRNASTCHVTIAEGPDAITGSAAAWQAVEDRGGAATPFQSFAMARVTAQAHLRDGHTPRIVTVQQWGRPVVIFPTVVGRLTGVSTVRFLGDPLIQYGDALATPEALAEHLEAAWLAAVDPRIASVGIFRKVRADSKLTALLTRRAATIAASDAPFVDLLGGPTSSSRHLREIRRLRRRLSEQGPLRFELYRGDSADEILNEMLAQKRSWLVQRGLPSSVIGRPSWERALSEMAQITGDRSEMIVSRLTVGGRTAATEIGFADATTWLAYTASFAPEFGRYGPGHVLMDDIMNWCRETGRRVYDLLAPAQPYKIAVSNGTVPIRDYAVALNPSGTFAIIAARSLPMAKRLAERVPLPLRRWCMPSYLKATGAS